ncbi:MAG: nodulation protein NfeD [Bacillota bacterium]|nr:nodulation protein NfeD [Bacillota bacterium]
MNSFHGIHFEKTPGTTPGGKGPLLLPRLLLCLLCLAFLFPAPAWSDPRANHIPPDDRARAPVLVATVTGPIVPVTARYCERAIRAAETKGATACVIQLNTPGGLYSATQELVTAILNARVPVVVFVSPAGGWAGSAGTFITISAHVAAMAPGSRIGAAHPVAVGAPDTPDVPSEKITEDAAAWARSIAQLRERNARAAELAVRESKSFSDAEALQENLIDLRARDLEDLLHQLEGRTVNLGSGLQVRLETRQAPVERLPMNFAEKFLLAVSNPDLAYLLLTIGMAGLMVEIYHPGLIFPGVAGGISLLLGLYSLGTLDAYWGGVLLMILAFGLFIAEAFLASHGVLGAGGIVSFVIGSLILFSNGPPGVRVSIWLVAAVALVFTGLMALLVTAVVRGQKRRVITGQEGLLGYTGIAKTDLNPAGIVLVAGELWNAKTEENMIKSGEEVVITGVEGLRLRVRRKG